MSADARCPRCRGEGRTRDCADDVIEAHLRDDEPDQDGQYELEVTLRFALPVESCLPLDPAQMATHMREQWMNDDTELLDVLWGAVHDDYDLTVRPVFAQ